MTRRATKKKKKRRRAPYEGFEGGRPAVDLRAGPLLRPGLAGRDVLPPPKDVSAEQSVSMAESQLCKRMGRRLWPVRVTSLAPLGSPRSSASSAVRPGRSSAHGKTSKKNGSRERKRELPSTPSGPALRTVRSPSHARCTRRCSSGGTRSACGRRAAERRRPTAR